MSSNIDFLLRPKQMEKENWTPAPLRLPAPALPHFSCLRNIWPCSGAAVWGRLCRTGMGRARCDKAPRGICPARCPRGTGDRVAVVPFLPEQTQITCCFMLVLSPVFFFFFFILEERMGFIQLSYEIWRWLPGIKQAWPWHCCCEGGGYRGGTVLGYVAFTPWGVCQLDAILQAALPTGFLQDIAPLLSPPPTPQKFARSYFEACITTFCEVP